jgi:hypothetical protein
VAEDGAVAQSHVAGDDQDVLVRCVATSAGDPDPRHQLTQCLQAMSSAVHRLSMDVDRDAALWPGADRRRHITPVHMRNARMYGVCYPHGLLFSTQPIANSMTQNP